MRWCSVWRWSGVLMLVAALAGCGGGGDGPRNITPNPPPPPGSGPTVTVSGKITFDRIPFDTTLGTGLNPNAPVESPARGVVVEAISGSAAIASTTTNATGDYSFAVPSNTQIFIRAKAQMLKSGATPTWDFRVLNNTNADALYALDGSSFNTGTTDSTRNLRASSGWTGAAYGATRAAAPFAVLDTVYQAMNLIVTTAPSAVFEPLNLYWSANNRSGTTDQQGNPILCIDDGDIQTTFYTSGGGTDSCGDPLLAGIYVLGAVEQGSGGAVGDTDEFDQHVLAHEFGHYFEAEFSRSDSIGGEHAEGDRLDMRVAFGEGWGNAFSGMVVNDPVYRDSFAVVASDFSFNMEADNTDFGDGGWFSETSIAEILWDLFDTTNETGDSVSLGFGPIFAALTDGQRTTAALTSIFSFIEALRDEAPGQNTGVNALLSGEGFSVIDEFGTGEDIDGEPIYQPIALNEPQQVVCVRTTNGVVNKLGYSKFLRLDLGSSALLTITVIGAAGTSGSLPAEDPDFYVYRQGAVVLAGEGTGPSETSPQTPLSPATYIIEVLDFELASGDPPHCMTISVTGA